MDRKTFERQKAFAGERVPSMKRRCVDHDYTERRMYMVTLVVEGRRKLFGEVCGRSDAPTGSAEAPRMVLSPLGEAVQRCWQEIPQHYPEISLLALQLMPDHLHGILFVRDKMDDHLGTVIKGFKTGCNKEYRQQVGYVATMSQHTQQQHTQQDAKKEDRKHGFLFEKGYNDRILLQDGQLQRWIDYLADNPRRLLAKREHPDLFRVQFGLEYAGQTYAAIGNRFLLQRPCKLQVQCSRSLTPEQIQAAVERYLAAARQGAVLVSPAISEGEKAVMHAAMEAHLPLIFLSANSFTPFTTPGGTFTEACSRGDLLILAPWSHRTTTQPLTRAECLALNAMTEKIVNE
ncbi:MAG: cobalamin biosynthesis protein [Bacteroidales bacterium]|nr:cobalamin biosynthesis protein [Bacteroidales bacterium]